MYVATAGHAKLGLDRLVVCPGPDGPDGPRSARPMTTSMSQKSNVELPFGWVGVSHHPQSRSGVGGRSPITRVGLVPSAMSVSLTFDRTYSTPLQFGHRPLLLAVPDTPAYRVTGRFPPAAPLS